MIALPLLDDNRAGPSGRTRAYLPPWDCQHPRWKELDAELPADHLARFIDRAVAQQLDLQPLLDSYAGRGSPPCPPLLLVRLVLFEYFQGRLSPLQWLTDLRDSLPVRWLMFGLVPACSTLYGFRDRIAPFVDDWNRSSLEAAQREGFLRVDVGVEDGTFLPARASRHQLLGEKGLRQRRQLLAWAVAFDEGRQRQLAPTGWWLLLAVLFWGTPEPAQRRSTPEEILDALLSPLCWPNWLAGTPRGRLEQLQAVRKGLRRWRRQCRQHQARQSQQSKAKRRGPEKVCVCLSEPEAALGRDKLNVFRPLYNVQLIRDLRTRFIVAYGTFTAVADQGLLPVMLQRCQRLTGRRLRAVVADPAYANGLDLAAAAEAQVEVYARPLGRGGTARAEQADESAPSPGKPRPQPLYGKERFRYVPERDVYVCPADQELTPRQKEKRRRRGDQQVEVVEYRTRPSVCAACTQRERCTRDRHGRSIKRSEHDPLQEQLRQRINSPAGQRLYRLRSQTIELAMAELHRRLGGYERLSSYGKRRARLQVGLAVLVLNLWELHKARERAARLAAPDSPEGSAQHP